MTVFCLRTGALPEPRDADSQGVPRYQFSKEGTAGERIDCGHLSKKEVNLIALIRGTGYGEIKIVVLDRQPIRAVEIKRSIKL
ncbi:hypothetical protein [Candidatus Formimonas warabiya]|uniref:Uncharacterized protein n=1 Tax=Formimonas warabiya TaxID=1761012 RepID=A0A3G1KYX8_FORW1|nr:hypothetical protein [Candidatus Formimonas warabiya]ATW27559.1 hypothetical protein DCMF_24895 [Candidatus Formimonas warabiya]